MPCCCLSSLLPFPRCCVLPPPAPSDHCPVDGAEAAGRCACRLEPIAAASCSSFDAAETSGGRGIRARRRRHHHMLGRHAGGHRQLQCGRSAGKGDCSSCSSGLLRGLASLHNSVGGTCSRVIRVRRHHHVFGGHATCLVGTPTADGGCSGGSVGKGVCYTWRGHAASCFLQPSVSQQQLEPAEGGW